MSDTSSPSRAGRKPRARIAVERLGPEHAEPIQDFFAREWGGDGAGSDGSGEVDPREPALDFSTPQWICLRNGEAIGYLGTIPVVFRVGGERLSATWLKGFWVTEKYRSGPVGPMLLKQAVSELDLIGSQVVAPAARRVQESEGFTHRCTLFNRVLLVRAHRVLGRVDLQQVVPGSVPAPLRTVAKVLQTIGVMSIAGGVAGLCIRGLGRIADAGSRAYTVRGGWDIDDHALDDLWARLRDQVHTTPDRAAESLRDRYEGDGKHDLYSVWSGDTLEGWSVLRRPAASTDPRLSGLRVASIADVFYPIGEPRVGSAARRAAEDGARRHGADAVLCSGSHPALQRLVAHRGYLTFPANVLIMARDGVAHAFATGGENMWVTRGDARSDEGF